MPWKKGQKRGDPDKPKEELKRPGPMAKDVVDWVEKVAARRGWTKRDAWERVAMAGVDLLNAEDGVCRMRLYEVRIYEPAVDGGLFPRVERWRYTNAYQWDVDDNRGKPLRQVGAEGIWWFRDGVADVYDPGSDTMTRAEIVGEIDEPIDVDRFVPILAGSDGGEING